MSTLLIIFAKEPTPGQVKTRLGSAITATAAAVLGETFLRDILDEMGRLPGLRLALGYSPQAALTFFQRLAPGALLFPQAGPDLGTRMAVAFSWGFGAGFDTVLLRGSDTPDLPGQVILEAQEALETGRADVVLGPACDGGYYLVGLKASQPRLFQGIDWSTPAVLPATLQRVQALGLKVCLLTPWRDIDTLEDLRLFLQRPHPRGAPGWRTHLAVQKLLGHNLINSR